jgi:hypothetical protein
LRLVHDWVEEFPEIQSVKMGFADCADLQNAAVSGGENMQYNNWPKDQMDLLRLYLAMISTTC